MTVDVVTVDVVTVDVVAVVVVVVHALASSPADLSAATMAPESAGQLLVVVTVVVGVVGVHWHCWLTAGTTKSAQMILDSMARSDATLGSRLEPE
mmetsp:Transcript_11613/g.9199  ORF Transcript_11613/g.9199 Transcript_11613/m.9199 type:complete len:95 (+) Transcript_11613:41-325(+)